MLKVISTHVFLRQRLHPGLLDTFAKAGAQGVELFAARQHFDYIGRPHLREIADWVRDNSVEPFSMHAPMFPDLEMGRGVEGLPIPVGPGHQPVERSGTVLETDDLDGDVATLTASGVHIEGGIQEQPWGRFVTFGDPDGNGIVLQETSVGA